MLKQLGRALALVTLLAAGAAAQTPAQTSAVPTVEDFARDASFTSASLSPSGHYLAGITHRGGFDSVAVIDLTTRQSSIVQRAREADGVKLEWVDWKNDDRLIIGARYKVSWMTPGGVTGSIIRHQDKTEDYWIARVLSSPRIGGEAVQMFEGQSNQLARGAIPTQLVSRLPHEPDSILLSAYSPTGNALWKANVTTGAVTKIDQADWDTYDWWVDANGAPVLKAEELPRNSGQRFFRRAPGGRDWTLVLSLERAEAANSTVFTPIAAAASPGAIYVAARPEGQDRAAIYAFDTATGAYGAPLLSHPVADFESAIIDRTSNALLGACADNQRVECVGIDPAMSRHLRGIDGFFGKKAPFKVVEMSDDQTVWLIEAAEPASPEAYYIYRRDASSITPVISTRSELLHAALATTQIVSYKGSDGADLWGFLTGAASGAPRPLVVMPHGGPESRDHSGYDDWAQFLASRGYAVFQPNFRGGSGFGRAFAEAGYRQWGKRMQDDITDGVKHLTAAGLADPARICIFGWSYGGYAALAGGALTPDLYKCVIAGAGPSDLRDMLAFERLEQGHGSAAYAYWVRAIGDPSADRDALAAVSPRQLANAFKAPVLLLHGVDDDIVPVSQSRDMEAALRAAGRDVKFVELANEGHYLKRYESRVRMYQELETFLNRNLPAR